jgi:hypothetical protein
MKGLVKLRPNLGTCGATEIMIALLEGGSYKPDLIERPGCVGH